MKIITEKKLKQTDYFKIIQILHDFGIHFDLLDLPDETDEELVKESVEKLTMGAKAEVRKKLAEMKLKPCWQCCSIKELKSFNQSATQSDNLAPECKDCNVDRCKAYREDQPTPECLDLESISHDVKTIMDSCQSILNIIGGK